MENRFWEKPLDQLTEKEWEALCDGCGLCCLHKLEDIETGKIYPTSVACDLLDLERCQCSNYQHRHDHVADCIKLTYALLAELSWLPKTCAYLLRYQNKPLPNWHKLISGDENSIHEHGITLRDKMIHERRVSSLHQFIIKDEEII